MSPDFLAGRYELTERLAGGGMGHVWRGRDRVLERIVAVKVVDLAAQDATARERFRREAVATAGLSAPNVVQIYDAGIDGDTAYLVMELLTGPSLSQLINDHGPLPIDEGIHVSREVVKGLLAAHRIGVVHRDIKPGNVMYHGDQIKLVDFGIAQLARNMGAQLTAPATALGTAAYMSPEQATGEGASEKSDWYALGCLMTTIFTGEPPFGGEALAVASQQINSKPPYLSQRRPEVPPALDQLVARMLAKDPADRPGGEEIGDQLRLLQVDPTAGTILLPTAAPSGGTAVMGATAASALGPRTPSEPPEPVVPVPAPPPITPERPSKKRSPWPIVLALILLLAAGAAVAFAVFDPGRTPVAPPTSSPTPQITPTPTPAGTTTRRTTTTRPRTTTTRPPTTTTPPTTSAPTVTTTQPTADSGTTGNPGNSPNGNPGNSGNSGSTGEANSGNSGSANSDRGSGNLGTDGNATAAANALAPVRVSTTREAG